MDAWGIKAKQTVERKEGSEVGVVTVKHDVDVWMLIYGMGAAGMKPRSQHSMGLQMINLAKVYQSLKCCKQCF